MRRYPYIDVARGIGMVLVVAGHAKGISMYLTCFFMQLFFVLSGYVYRQGKSYKQNMKRKTERLLVPYFLGSIVLLGIYKVLGRTTKEMLFSGIGVLYSRYCFYNMDIAAEKNNIFFLDIANGAMWYLTSLFTAGAVYYAVIDVCIRSKKKCAGYIICFLAVSVCLAKLPILLPWSIDIAFAGAVLMIAGTLLGQNCSIEKWKKKWIFCIVVLFFVLAKVNPGINISVRSYGNYGAWSVLLFILVGICGSILCMWAGAMIESMWLGKILAYIGKNTVVILIFHIFILQSTEVIAEKIMELPPPESGWNLCYQIVRITVAIVLCLLLNRCLEYGKKVCMNKKKIRGDET